MNTTDPIADMLTRIRNASNSKQYADKVILLDKEVIKEGTPEQVFESLEFKCKFGQI